MGAFSSRQNAAVEEAEQCSNYAYKYPPRNGNFFGSHFIMGGERFDTPQPESYLFGENADLNFLGSRPTAFPYPPPQANEPTKTLKCLINIRKESVRFVRIASDKKVSYSSLESNGSTEQIDGNILCIGGGDADIPPPSYNIEFTFDADCKCAITIYYCCTEEISPSGVTLMPKDGLISETYRYDRGMNQYFCQPGHVFNPQLIPEDDLVYSSGRDQYPVAIHCVAEEGNEDCHQSHTTICVIDHHPDSNVYVLRALKQKIFADGLCYLLQEIYGIENKAVNKSSIDEDLDDHGSECVICMSETRDTLILPCRHLCLCNSCADSLRYQANNCPICRAPFRALLQIKAVQKGVTPHVIHQNQSTVSSGEQVPTEVHLPPGYIPISLIEALNGPPQYIGRPRASDVDITDGIVTIPTDLSIREAHKNSSPMKSHGHRRQKSKKHVSTNTAEVTNSVNTGNPPGIIEVDENSPKAVVVSKNKAAGDSNTEKAPVRILRDKMHIVNERPQSQPVSRIKQNSLNKNNLPNATCEDDDDDSETEKLSPLISPGSKCKPIPKKLIKSLSNDSIVDSNNLEDNSNGSQLKQNNDKLKCSSPDDLNLYTQDTLCVDCEQLKSTDKVGSLRVPLNGSNNLMNKNLYKKSTSVGNIVGSGSNNSNDLKPNVSSLPDMLDSPISGNSASTRSSSDSYSSSSSTKQLLGTSSVPVTNNPAHIIVDEKTSLQNAVNV